MNKRVVHYTPCANDYIVLGAGAIVVPIDHPSSYVDNGCVCYTTKVVSLSDNGEFETKNTKYIPKTLDKQA